MNGSVGVVVEVEVEMEDEDKDKDEDEASDGVSHEDMIGWMIH